MVSCVILFTHTIATGHCGRITRQGCEFDGSIIPPSNWIRYRNEPQFSEADMEQKTRLRAWYDSARVSGYGDVQDQVTKIDASVRAREIPASEFTVAPGPDCERVGYALLL